MPAVWSFCVVQPQIPHILVVLLAQLQIPLQVNIDPQCYDLIQTLAPVFPPDALVSQLGSHRLRSLANSLADFLLMVLSHSRLPLPSLELHRAKRAAHSSPLLPVNIVAHVSGVLLAGWG